jgi:hypothetical protein
MNNNTLTYFAKHFQSKSVALLECKRVKNKVKIGKVFFAKGNVISLVSVRNILNMAKEQL